MLSSELWECLNVTWQQLPLQRRDAARLGPYTFLRYVRERCAMLSGLADATLSVEARTVRGHVGRDRHRLMFQCSGHRESLVL